MTEEQVKGWQDMWTQAAARLHERTGADLAEWNTRVAETGIGTQAKLRAWLDNQDVRGYAQTLLVYERFGYPPFLVATPDELVDAQYADRAHLRPVYDAIRRRLEVIGPHTVQTRKTYVSLVTPRRTFAIVRPTTRARVDLGLRLDGAEPQGRLLPARSLGSETINVRVPLADVADVDDDVSALLERAYEANC